MILAGRVKPDADVLLSTGCVAILSVSQGQAQSLAQMLRAAPVSTERAAATVMRLWTRRPGPAAI